MWRTMPVTSLLISLNSFIASMQADDLAGVDRAARTDVGSAAPGDGER